jgi:hypothetical protein
MQAGSDDPAAGKAARLASLLASERPHAKACFVRIVPQDDAGTPLWPA